MKWRLAHADKTKNEKAKQDDVRKQLCQMNQYNKYLASLSVKLAFRFDQTIYSYFVTAWLQQDIHEVRTCLFETLPAACVIILFACCCCYLY